MYSVDDEKYKKAESAFQLLSKKFVSLKEEEKKTYQDYLKRLLDEIISLFKDSDALFKELFNEIEWAGSYWDRIRVSEPTEFDIDLVMKLPMKQFKIENVTQSPGFVKINIGNEMERLHKDPKWSIYKAMEKWVDEKSYLLESKFRSWMESVVSKAKNSAVNIQHSWNIRDFTLEDPKKSGPAITLRVRNPDNTKVDIDLVPVIRFEYPTWPKSPVRVYDESFTQKVWCVAAKPKNEAHHIPNNSWRLCFLKQEREIINDKRWLKPTCRLIKKLRDTENWASLKSYFIKTVFLWTVEREDESFWKKNQASVFMNMLLKLNKMLEYGEIPYYWDERHNLLDSCNEDTISNMHNRLSRIIKKIDSDVENNPYIIAENVLTKEEYGKYLGYLSEEKNDHSIARQFLGTSTFSNEYHEFEKKNDDEKPAEGLCLII